MRIGVDSYSYHRLLGYPRPFEDPPAVTLANGGPAVITMARDVGCAVVSLQTCFLGEPERVDPGALLGAAGDEVELVLAWGHPHGLAFGADPEALDDLGRWLPVAHALGGSLFRITVGGPALRHAEPVDVQLRRTVEPLRHAVSMARDLGLELAVENHGDLTTGELMELLGLVGEPELGVCFDTANAARVGEDAVVGAACARDRVRMVHLKDIGSPDTAADAVTGPVSVPFGEGVIPVREVLEVLREPVAAGAPVCVEIGQVRAGDDELQLIESGVRWLQRER